MTSLPGALSLVVVTALRVAEYNWLLL